MNKNNWLHGSLFKNISKLAANACWIGIFSMKDNIMDTNKKIAASYIEANPTVGPDPVFDMLSNPGERIIMPQDTESIHPEVAFPDTVHENRRLIDEIANTLNHISVDELLSD